MVNLDAAQRRFVMRRIAQYCPQNLIIGAFATRWGMILKPIDLAKCDPDFGGLLSPDDSEFFKQSRAEVDPNNEGIGSRNVRLIVLNWQFLDYNSRGDYRGVASVIDRINTMMQSETPTGTPITAIEWIAMSPLKSVKEEA